jgi:alkylation response protein AidB-like acyl-CoA dehydrogenase
VQEVCVTQQRTGEESSDRRDVRALTVSLLAKHLPPWKVSDLDESEQFDRPTWTALGHAGLLGLGAPEDRGGSGGTVGDAAAVTEEIARVLPSLAVDYVLAGMAARLLAAGSLSGSVADLLEQVVSGSRLCAFGLSEPNAGSDLLALTTRATLVGDEWLISGQKAWISLAGEADTIFVLCRTEGDDTPRAARHTLIAGPADQPGVSTVRTHLAGMRAAMTYDVFLDEARAPVDHVVGRRGHGLGVLSRSLDVERLMAAAISLGIGSAALALHVAHARDRKAFRRSIGAFQAVQHPAADSHAELTAARSVLNECIRALESGRDARELSAMAKLVCSETTLRVVDRAARAMGAMGLARESAMQMYLRDARLQLFSPISNEMIRNLLAEGLGLPRSY